MIFIQSYEIFDENYFYNIVLQVNKEKVQEALNLKNECYYSKCIPKKNGLRRLNCIKNESALYQLQTNLLNNFLRNIPVSSNAFGFIKGYSYYDYLIPHKNNKEEKKYYLRIDISDFFTCIDEPLIEEVISQYFKSYKNDEREALIKVFNDIVIFNGVLPQGAVTSPAVSNIVFRQLDLRIQKYCEKLNVTFTRYADDMLFSCNSNRLHEKFFIKAITTILRSKGFELNYSKVKKGYLEISLGGFVVSSDIRLSRKKRKDISKILFVFEKDGEPSCVGEYIDRINQETLLYRRKSLGSYFESKHSLLNYLCGYRSFLLNYLPEEKNECEKNIQLLRRIENLVEKLNNIN